MLFDIAFIIFLIILNAFFVASEISLVAARKSHLESLIRKKSIVSRALQTNVKNINLFITAMQVGNTLISIAVGWRGQVLVHTVINNNLHSYIEKYSFLNNQLITSVIPFLLITGILMIFGELIPKKLSMRSPERNAFLLALPTALYSFVFDPIITFVDKLTEILLRFFGLDGMKKEIPVSEKELRIIIHQSVKDGVIPQSLQSLIFNSLRLKNVKSSNVMHNHSSVVSFPTHATIDEIHHEISLKNHRFLRYVVHHKKKNNTVGFFESADLLAMSGKNRRITLKESNIIKRAITVDQNKGLDEVLAQMIQAERYVAIVYDVRKPMGIITINTIIKELTRRID